MSEQAEELIDGMSFEQVRFNIYAFAADVRKFGRKMQRARLPHTRLKWQKKRDEAARYLENNKQRIGKFTWKPEPDTL
jgi:hypothetical protein